MSDFPDYSATAEARQKLWEKAGRAQTLSKLSIEEYNKFVKRRISIAHEHLKEQVQEALGLVFCPHCISRPPSLGTAVEFSPLVHRIDPDVMGVFAAGMATAACLNCGFSELYPLKGAPKNTSDLTQREMEKLERLRSELQRQAAMNNYPPLASALNSRGLMGSALQPASEGRSKYDQLRNLFEDKFL